MLQPVSLLDIATGVTTSTSDVIGVMSPRRHHSYRIHPGADVIKVTFHIGLLYECETSYTLHELMR